jgi:hypothetical protein
MPFRSLIVRGHDLMGDENLPGAVMVIEPPLEHDGELVRSVLQRFDFGVRLRAVPSVAWRRDVAIHSTRRNIAGTCARVPIILELLQPRGDSSDDIDFDIGAIEYNPEIFISGHLVKVAAALGLATALFGLRVCARSSAALLAACTWMRTGSGMACIADADFLHTMPDCYIGLWQRKYLEEPRGVLKALLYCYDLLLSVSSLHVGLLGARRVASLLATAT